MVFFHHVKSLLDSVKILDSPILCFLGLSKRVSLFISFSKLAFDNLQFRCYWYNDLIMHISWKNYYHPLITFSGNLLVPTDDENCFLVNV